MTLQRTILRDRAEGEAVSCPALIFISTAVFLLIGILTYAEWQITGDPSWIDGFFHLPNSLFAVSLSLVQVVFTLRVRGQFSREGPLYLAWHWIAFSAVCDLVSALAVQIFSINSPLNPLIHWVKWSADLEVSIRQAGLAVGGSLRFALLAAGLLFALRIYRNSGFLGRLTAFDWVLLAAAVVYVGREFWDLSVALRHGKQPGWAEIANWPVDPLLCVLLAEGMLLYRSVRNMGPGWVGRSWLAFSAGILLVVLGDFAIWAAAYGYLPYPWSNIEWYLWLPAAAAFAMAPAYQLEVIQKAGGRRFKKK